MAREEPVIKEGRDFSNFSIRLLKISAFDIGGFTLKAYA